MAKSGSSGTEPASIHASAVLVGARAILIRGAAGSGKSRLALALIEAAETGLLRFARLVADDRTHVQAVHGRLLARPAEMLAGLIEVRGLGVRRLPFEPLAVVGLVVDLGAGASERLPQSSTASLAGVAVPRLAVAPGFDPLPIVLATLTTMAAEGSQEGRHDLHVNPMGAPDHI
ncbi:MAG: HPr kinase/phosphorylase [Xanthobacteraceae bacterium]